MPPEDNKYGSTQVLGLGLAAALVASAVAGGLALGAAALAQGPGEAMSAVQEERSGPALVRFAHTGPDALSVNVTIDDQTVLTNESFGNVSDYLRVAPGSHTVTIEEARAGGEVLLEEDLTFEAGTNYTVAVTGEVTAGETFEATVLEDELRAPAENESLVRLVHLSPDAPTVDVTVEGTDRVLFENVTYRNASGYVSVPAGNYTLEVREATPNGSGEVLATANVSLSGGTASTAFAVGYQNVAGAIMDRPLRILIADPVVSEPSPDTMITPTPAGTPDETPTPTEANETSG